LSLVLREGTVTGGQKARHSLLLQSRWLVVSGLKAYSVRPCALTTTRSPSFELDAELILTVALAANAIAAANTAMASNAAAPPGVAIARRLLGRQRVLCCLPASDMSLPSLWCLSNRRRRAGQPSDGLVAFQGWV
jgi:hypothetical protein